MTICKLGSKYLFSRHQDALGLAVKVFSKTLDVNKLTPDKFEISTLTIVDGKTVFRTLPNTEVNTYMYASTGPSVRLSVRPKCFT